MIQSIIDHPIFVNLFTTPVKYGFVLPRGDAKFAVELAKIAEEANWDGFFVWEPVWGVDAWVTLTAVSMVTRKIKLGTMISPISRMRPWKLASETATLDHLSNGRVILSVGLGAPEAGWESFGEIIDRKTRAELLDEGIDIIRGLWNGQPFSYSGKHYQINEFTFDEGGKHYPSPVNGQVPIWVVGAWNWPKSMNRVLKCEGILPVILDKEKKIQKLTTQHVRDIREFIEREKDDPSHFDIIVESHMIENSSKNKQELFQEWESAGATWWIESLWDKTSKPEYMKILKERLSKGP